MYLEEYFASEIRKFIHVYMHEFTSFGIDEKTVLWNSRDIWNTKVLALSVGDIS